VTGIERFVAIVGLPRSGTTVLTALLDAHPGLFLYYEPWNASKKNPPEPPSDLAGFCASMASRFAIRVPSDVRIVGFKETTILPGSLDFASRTLQNVSRETPSHVIWIVRDPIQCLFSKVEAARRWWGHPDAHFSRQTLVSHLRDSGPSLVWLRRLVERHGGSILTYEGLVRRPRSTLSSVLASLGEDFDPAQLRYHEAGPQPRKVMGDVEVAQEPAALSAGRHENRQRQILENAALIEDVLSDPEFRWIRGERERLLTLDDVTLVAGADRGTGRPGPASAGPSA